MKEKMLKTHLCVDEKDISKLYAGKKDPMVLVYLVGNDLSTLLSVTLCRSLEVVVHLLVVFGT